MGARQAGADVAWSEIVGLVPERALRSTSEAHLKLKEPILPHLLEQKVRESAGPSLDGFLDQVASASPTPGGGTVSALAGAISRLLNAMVTRPPGAAPLSELNALTIDVITGTGGGVVAVSANVTEPAPATVATIWTSL